MPQQRAGYSSSILRQRGPLFTSSFIISYSFLGFHFYMLKLPRNFLDVCSNSRKDGVYTSTYSLLLIYCTIFLVHNNRFIFDFCPFALL